MTHALVTGCSHTRGQGIDPADCYGNQLSLHYNMPVTNWSISGAGCNDVLLFLKRAVQLEDKPEFIVAQWPNPFRRTLWQRGQKKLQNIHACDDSFRLLLAAGDENFYEPWMQAVEIGNLLCKATGIPIINILLESLDQKYLGRLSDLGIELHIDEKLPGRTWLFDSAASDNLHHSADCHRQWTERLIGLINELTTR